MYMSTTSTNDLRLLNILQKSSKSKVSISPHKSQPRTKNLQPPIESILHLLYITKVTCGPVLNLNKLKQKQISCLLFYLTQTNLFYVIKYLVWNKLNNKHEKNERRVCSCDVRLNINYIVTYYIVWINSIKH